MSRLNVSIARTLAAALSVFVVLSLGGCRSATYSSIVAGPGSPVPPNGFPPPQMTSGVVLATYTSPDGMVYDRTHKYLFVTVTKLDRVDVFSTADYRLVASIPVPASMGI